MARGRWQISHGETRLQNPAEPKVSEGLTFAFLEICQTKAPFLSTEGHEEHLSLIREGARRAAKDTFLSAEDAEGAENTFLIHEGPRRTPFLSTEGQGGPRRTPFCPRHRAENTFLSAEGQGGPRRTLGAYQIFVSQLHSSSGSSRTLLPRIFISSNVNES